MNKIRLTFFGIIIGGSLIASAFIVSQTFLDVRRLDDAISVSGSSRQAVTSDSARWTGSFSRIFMADNLKDGYAQMKKDEQAVNSFLTSSGFQGKFEISPVFMYEVYHQDQSAPREYNLTQNIELKSQDVEAVKSLAKNVEKLAEQGIIFSAGPVEYYYSQLPEARVSLLPEAIKDAKARAEAIALSSGKKVGAIKSVSMGVVQVMPVGAVEISDYGTYDTSSVEKEVMVTVKASFGLE